MGIRFPSEEWIQALKDQLNASEAYERSAKDWEGDFIFVAEPDAAYPEHAYLFLGLYHGKCTDAALIHSQDERKAEFVISAAFGVWRQVIEGKLDPIQGMMTRKLKLSGNMMKIMRYPKAAKEIIACCAKVPTDFE
ncbi:MAG TPA: SCP2 sterol-binding domain-containing protein [Anaerolineae bacterium]|nr:SCP2 sterol-binding domain-containing protein [Anaerolineae bacterium]HOQ99053.1 SCP2 sterol-binding domain-containing protein [Anaerolineae bacterium]HPL27817.1 SCP2 sterol-binding domain-containing protein [Anaerolineae bacterium]